MKTTSPRSLVTLTAVARLEHLGKIVRDFLGVSASGFIVGQRGSEAVENPRPLNDVKMISPHDATMNELKPRFPSH